MLICATGKGKGADGHVGGKLSAGGGRRKTAGGGKWQRQRRDGVGGNWKPPGHERLDMWSRRCGLRFGQWRPGSCPERAEHTSPGQSRRSRRRPG
jgi:hypothetical protein